MGRFVTRGVNSLFKTRIIDINICPELNYLTHNEVSKSDLCVNIHTFFHPQKRSNSLCKYNLFLGLG